MNQSPTLPNLPSGIGPAPGSLASVSGPSATVPAATPPPGQNRPARTDMTKLLDAVIKYDASDLHLTVGRPPTVRIRGELHNLGQAVLTPEDTTLLMKSITGERHQQELAEHGGCDFGFAYQDKARFRVSVFRQKGVLGMALRLIPSRMRSFEEIGLPNVIKDMCMRPRGLVLVTGPTGSGKTTTLATMIDFINSECTDHIVTIEDPIEYYHTHRKGIVTQREVGLDVPSFAEALRRVLRMDPDVILVGELRDLETIRTALRAAETGHLVFSTLHTTGAAETVNRIVDQFPADEQEQVRTMLAATLISVISQTLLPTADGKGRVAAFELMFVNDPIKALIRKNEAYKVGSHIQTGASEGMILLDEFLFNLWASGKVTYNEMIRCAQDLPTLEKKVRDYTEAMRKSRR